MDRPRCTEKARVGLFPVFVVAVSPEISSSQAGASPMNRYLVRLEGLVLCGFQSETLDVSETWGLKWIVIELDDGTIFRKPHQI